jgi:predicted nucleotidyltransferase
MEDLDSSSILNVLKENLEELQSFGVERIGLFGSFLRGDANEESDLDFLVVFEENTFDDYMGLKLFLEDLFDRSVDLVIESDVREELDHVKRDAEYVTPA